MNLQVAQYADEVDNNKVASSEVDQCLRYHFRYEFSILSLAVFREITTAFDHFRSCN